MRRHKQPCLHVIGDPYLVSITKIPLYHDTVPLMYSRSLYPNFTHPNIPIIIIEHHIEQPFPYVTATPMKCYCHAYFAVHVLDLGSANETSNGKKSISAATHVKRTAWTRGWCEHWWVQHGYTRMYANNYRFTSGHAKTHRYKRFKNKRRWSFDVKVSL